jgi:urea transport system ATP-binding protein
VFLPDGLYFPLKRLGKRINLRPQLDIVVCEPTNSDADVEIAFEGSGIKQKYGDFVALNIENIEFSKGVVAALIGPNGAGKTTFISYLSGGLRDAAGNSSVFGNSIERKYDFEIAQMGVKRKFQTPSVFEDMSIQDNLFLGAAQPLTFPKSWFSRSHELSLPREVIALAQEASLLDHSSESAGDLSHGAKQFLEVCMVLASQPHLLLLDEPTAGMIQKDRYRIGEVIKDLAKQGRAILIVEHDFDFVRSISDRIYVLHQGSLITLGSPKEVSRNSQVRELYLGSSV